jgi:predicted DCC family thiol-disulfide oxidoreductase YuxK
VNGWSGGQYSLYRMLLGAGVSVRLAVGPADPLAWIGVGLAVLVAAGRFDRFAAAALAGLCLVHWMPYAAVLLVLHLAAPPAPYGSWQAAGRLDPGYGWQLAGWIPLAARLMLAGAWVHGLFVGPFPFGPGFLLAHLLAFDPGWIPRRSGGAPATVFYDGHCGLCHRSVRFLLAEDRDGTAFRYAPLDSNAFAAGVPEAERDALPDSIVLQLPDGARATRSAAFVEIGARLGGFWRAGAAALAWLPARLADRAYDFVAARRTRMFGRTEDACPRVPPELAARFLT